MRVNCADVEEAIWSSICNGTALGDIESRHIDKCKSCAKALVEAKTGIQVLGSLRSYPTAPDYRMQIQQQIAEIESTKYKPWLLVGWVAAPAALVSLLLIALYFSQITNSSKPQIQRYSIVASINQHSAINTNLSHNAKITMDKDEKGVRTAKTVHRYARRIIVVNSYVLPQNINTKHVKTKNTGDRGGENQQTHEEHSIIHVSKIDMNSEASAPVEKAVSFTWSSDPSDNAPYYEYTEQEYRGDEIITQQVKQVSEATSVHIYSPTATPSPTRGMLNTGSDYKNYSG